MAAAETIAAGALALSIAAGAAGAVRGVSAGGRQTPGAGAMTGKPAPAFSLRDLSGRPLDLASYRGRVVLLDFWATWCVPCREEIPHFVALQKKYGSKGLAIIGISMDDEEGPVRDFYRKYGMNYPVAMGDAKLAERYGGILGLPVAFLIDRTGRIAWRLDGETPAATFEQHITELLAR
ncbi:MAG: TlpA family protein disulfide reductase [Betaproteobacteria bacterium]